MQLSSINNPFAAPVYHRETVSSTMDEARLLAARGEVHGTVVAADFQEAGRGRTTGRAWQADRGRNLFFTILLRYGGFAAIPKAITLKTGLALSLAIEDFAPALTGTVLVKWPNDVMIGAPSPVAGTAQAAGKAAGILTEGDGTVVYIGIGVNVGQTEFPEALRGKATSIALALGKRSGEDDGQDRFRLLEKILARLHRELAGPPDTAALGITGRDAIVLNAAGDWRSRLEARLFRRDCPVRFLAGGVDAGTPVAGILRGIGPEGELLILPDGEDTARSFVTGELEVYR
ncbi:biotin--[acetyl-CoA-carboxylase] ligase [Spirochaetia bacterium]|nr:biotin--[acetyl-CoA-carboxylase] ligase [Spirochaetia bacterium]